MHSVICYDAISANGEQQNFNDTAICFEISTDFLFRWKARERQIVQAVGGKTLTSNGQSDSIH